MASVFDHFSDLHMQALDRIGRIDHFANLGCIAKEGNHLVPDSAPALGDSGNLFTPLAFFKLIQAFGGYLGGLGTVDIFEFPRYGLALFPVTIRQAVAD